MKKLLQKYILQPLRDLLSRILPSGHPSAPEHPPVDAPSPEPQPDPQPQPDPPSTLPEDETPFHDLRWEYGGFDGSKASPSAPRIGSLRLSGETLSLKWIVGLEHWGLSHSEAGAVCALFCLVDGRWIGGKFEWISTSRATRSLSNVRNRYNGWDPSAPDRATALALVVVSGDRRHRSNTILLKR